MSKTNPKADFYFSNSEKWQKEMKKLRTIALGCGLSEELKWGCPSYTMDKTNIVLIHEFKEYCAYLFFKGALMKDPKKLLIQQTKNVQAARQIRFTSVPEITKLETALKAYIKEAIAVEKAGLKVSFKTTAQFDRPDEFQSRLDAMPALRRAFEALTPGRQKGYLLHFSSAKQSKTRETRVEKCIPLILDGMGLDD
ncbi:MAG: YdeI/OmpD-associated family protein [Fibrobacteria bacterium]